MRDAPLPLALQGVSLTLPSAAGPVQILREVDLTISPRERVAVTGPSGSGKSSLIAVAAGLESLASIPSPILGPEGNREFLLHLRVPAWAAA